MNQSKVRIAASIALATMLAACSSGTSATPAGSTGASTPAISAAAGASAGAAASGAFDLASFKAKVTAAMASEQAWQGPTAKVTPPKKFKIAAITCLSALNGCYTPAVGVQNAAKALGWDSEIFDGKGDPKVQSDRIEQAIVDGANAIVTVAINGDAIKGALDKAKQAGVIVISSSNGSAPGEQGFQLDVSPNLTDMGKALADWVIVDSNGTSNFVPWLDKEFQSNISTEDGLLSEYKLCTTCTLQDTQNFVATDVGNGLGAATVAYFRKNPKVNYTHFSFDPAALDQVPALIQAGFGQVKATSILGDGPNLDFISQGKVQAADGGWDNEYMGWAAVDQVIRLATNQPLAVADGQPDRYKYGENTPWVLLTKDNLPAGGKDWHASFDYQSQFKQLWGVN